MDKVYEELKVKAPLFHRLLAAASTNRRSRSKAPQTEVLHAGTAMVVAICLRNRSKFMSAVQLLITIFLYHSNWLVSLRRQSVVSVKEILYIYRVCFVSDKCIVNKYLFKLKYVWYAFSRFSMLENKLKFPQEKYSLFQVMGMINGCFEV